MEQKREPRNRPTQYSLLICGKGIKTKQWSKIIFSINGAWIYKKMNLDIDFILFIKINLKCITDINIVCKTIKLLPNNVEGTLDGLGYCDDILLQHQKNGA